jgi:DNA-binding response OmpR family regulator
LLAALVRREGRIVSREELYETVWGAPLRAHDRSVDVYVHKVRAKLAAALPGWDFIHTHFGFGYRFAPERSHAFHSTRTGR